MNILRKNDAVQNFFRNSMNGYWIYRDFAFSHIVHLENGILVSVLYNVIIKDSIYEFHKIENEFRLPCSTIFRDSLTELTIIVNDKTIRDRLGIPNDKNLILKHYMPRIPDPSFFQKNPL